jgi:hypothetical protein
MSTFTTTGELVDRLQKSGLNVNRNKIYLDIQDRYFYSRNVESLDQGKLIGRLWESWEVRRAFYLYRLRKRGVEGKLLRVLLFLRDGKGWEDVHPICLAGITKMIEMNKIPVRKQLRDINETSVVSIMDDVIEGMKPIHRLKKRTALFVWGLGFFGKALKYGSLNVIASALSKFIVGRKLEPNNPINKQMEIAKQILVSSSLNWDQIIEIVKNASPEQANIARQRFRRFLNDFRQWLHANHRRQGLKQQSSNMLTWGGRSTAEFAEALREPSIRLTPAQVMAAMIGIVLVVEEILKPDLLLDLLMNLIRLSKRS